MQTDASSETMDRSMETERKVERVRRWLREQERSALVIRQRNNFAWITAGGRGHVNTARDASVGAIVVTADRVVLVASNIEARRLIEEELVGTRIDVMEYAWHDADGERRLIADVSGSDGSACDDGAPAIASAVAVLRASLLPPEICRVERLGREAAAIVEATCRAIEAGMAEYDVAARVHAAAQAIGARVPVCLVAADDRIGTRRHPLPTGNVVRARAMVAVCIERDGLTCSVTRLVSLVPMDADLRRRHDAVCRVDATAMCGTRVGRPLREIFEEMVSAYANVGFADEWQHHHQGGSTGYQPRDVIVGPAATACVQESQLFAWNPSIAGTKSEDTILATSTSFRCLTTSGSDWPSLEVELDGEIVSRPDILVRA